MPNASAQHASTERFPIDVHYSLVVFVKIEIFWDQKELRATSVTKQGNGTQHSLPRPFRFLDLLASAAVACP